MGAGWWYCVRIYVFVFRGLDGRDVMTLKAPHSHTSCCFTLSCGVLLHPVLRFVAGVKCSSWPSGQACRGSRRDML